MTIISPSIYIITDVSIYIITDPTIWAKLCVGGFIDFKLEIVFPKEVKFKNFKLIILLCFVTFVFVQSYKSVGFNFKALSYTYFFKYELRLP